MNDNEAVIIGCSSKNIDSMDKSKLEQYIMKDGDVIISTCKKQITDIFFQGYYD